MKIQIEVPSYEQAKTLAVELRVEGGDDHALLTSLLVDPATIRVQEPVNGPSATMATVYPFASMTEAEYSTWVAELLRRKLSEHWHHRW